MNKRFWTIFSNALVWSVIGTLLLIGGLQFLDKKTGYKVLNNHTAVVVSESMSTVHPNNLTYLEPNIDHIEKGDIIKAKEYKSFEKVELYDVVIYMSSDGNLICHRVVDKYVDEKGQWIVTKGDANPTIDTPVSYKLVHGKVTKTIKHGGNVALFMQSPYFLIALFGSGFSIFLGILIVELLGNKKEKDKKSLQNFKEKYQESPKADENVNKTPEKPKSSSSTSVKAILIPLLVASGITLSILSTTNAYALFSRNADEISFGIGSPSAAFYANIYNEDGVFVSSAALSVNPSNHDEMMVENLSLQKGYKVKGYKTATDTYFGGSYSHNISVGCTVASGLVSASDDYIAVQTGTYNFYFKFSDDTYSSYVSTYVNVNEVNTYYLQDTLDKGYSPAVHYWGDNVITSEADNYWGGTYVGVEGNHSMYRVYIPSNATSFNFSHDEKYSQNFIIADLGSNNSFWLDSVNNSGSYTWNP